ncbi:urease accessory protein UreH domain-containing protein [Treponema sp. R6D11]
MEITEKQNLQKRSFRIGGMYCVNCQNIIEKELKKTAGIKKAAVNYRTEHAVVTYDEAVIGFDKISSIIKELGYQALEGQEKTSPQKTIPRVIGTLVIILALFMLLRTFTTSKLAATFPLAQEGMGYGMLLVIGLLTGVHCIAMCGGINLSQTLKKADAPADTASQTADSKPSIKNFSLLLPSILYNGGRLISYTAVGVLVGALGSVITLSGHFKGVVQLVAGVFMVIMGINMLGLFPFLRHIIPQMPKIFTKKTDEQKNGRSPLVVGFLNGFMPCGPLQAMQVYALSTGSPVKGGISMFLFCAGTIPLMFALGAASSVLSGAKGQTFSRRVMQVGAILVTALGLVMFSSGLSLSDFSDSPENSATADARKVNNENSNPRTLQERQQTLSAPNNASPPEPKPFVPVIENGVQVVKSTLRSNRYPAITVQQGIPVRWIINAPPGSITGCNYAAIFNEYGFEYTFQQGENVIEFTPTKAGRFRYSCWMGMIRSTITVVAEAKKEG